MRSFQILLTGLILLAAAWPLCVAESAAPRSFRNILFAVLDHNITPIAFLENGRFQGTPIDDQDAPEGVAFSKKYFPPGKTYPLYEGGGRAKEIVVTKPYQSGCVSMNAEITHKPNRMTPVGYTALALASPIVVKKATRRGLNPQEKAILRKQAEPTFRENGVSAPEMTDAYAIDVNHDGRMELIGSFNLELADNAAGYHLTLFLEPKTGRAGQYTIAHQLFHKTVSDASDERHSLRFIDVLDLNGDGVDELVLENSYYESYDFEILRKVKGVWKSVYKGNGGGC